MLKVKFWRIENVVLMKVLEQGEEIERGCGEFFCQNGFSLYSYTGQSLIENGLAVRGDYIDYDNHIVIQEFPSIKKAKKCIKSATEAIHAYNQSIAEKPEQTDDIETVIAE